MPKKTSKPGEIHLRIIEVMKRFPDGVTGGQLRQELEKEGLRPEEQTHLDRRKRDLLKWFVIQKSSRKQLVNGKNRTVALYKYVGDGRALLTRGPLARSSGQRPCWRTFGIGTTYQDQVEQF
jgi:hypothetical protein